MKELKIIRQYLEYRRRHSHKPEYAEAVATTDGFDEDLLILKLGAPLSDEPGIDNIDGLCELLKMCKYSRKRTFQIKSIIRFV